MRALKRLLSRRFYGLMAPVPPASPGAGTGPPVVAGFLRTPSGIGESARLCHAAFARLGWQPGRRDLSARFQPADMLETGTGDEDMGAGTGPLVLHVNPPELPAAATHLGARLIRDRLVVGYWAWELPELPASWLDGFRFVHEIWVPSTFCAEAVRRHTTKPVRVVPHPVAFPDDARPDRAGFGLPDDAFVVLAACDLRSSAARKNPLGALAAFAGAFGERPDCLLLLKVGGRAAEPAAFDALARHAAGYANVRILARPLSPARMHALLASIDSLLSLHRSEGFGLMPAQAMLAGKAVVATDWSGSRDFLTADTAALVPATLVPVEDSQGIYGGAGQCWAEPDLSTAAAHLVSLREYPAEREALGRRAAVHMRAFSSDARYCAALGPEFLAAVGER